MGTVGPVRLAGLTAVSTLYDSSLRCCSVGPHRRAEPVVHLLGKGGHDLRRFGTGSSVARLADPHVERGAQPQQRLAMLWLCRVHQIVDLVRVALRVVEFLARAARVPSVRGGSGELALCVQLAHQRDDAETLFLVAVQRGERRDPGCSCGGSDSARRGPSGCAGPFRRCGRARRRHTSAAGRVRSRGRAGPASAADAPSRHSTASWR